MGNEIKSAKQCKQSTSNLFCKKVTADIHEGSHANSVRHTEHHTNKGSIDAVLHVLLHSLR